MQTRTSLCRSARRNMCKAHMLESEGAVAPHTAPLADPSSAFLLAALSRSPAHVAAITGVTIQHWQRLQNLSWRAHAVVWRSKSKHKTQECITAALMDSFEQSSVDGFLSSHASAGPLRTRRFATVNGEATLEQQLQQRSRRMALVNDASQPRAVPRLASLRPLRGPALALKAAHLHSPHAFTLAATGLLASARDMIAQPVNSRARQRRARAFDRTSLRTPQPGVLPSGHPLLLLPPLTETTADTDTVEDKRGTTRTSMMPRHHTTHRPLRSSTDHSTVTRRASDATNTAMPGSGDELDLAHRRYLAGGWTADLDASDRAEAVPTGSATTHPAASGSATAALPLSHAIGLGVTCGGFSGALICRSHG